MEGQSLEVSDLDLGKLLAEQMDRLGRIKKEDADFDDTLGLFALGGAKATDADVSYLMRYADRHPSPKARASTLLVLSTVGDRPEVDAYYLRWANDSQATLGDRLVSWKCLQTRGKEDLVSITVRRDILRLWKESGTTKLTDLFD